MIKYYIKIKRIELFIKESSYNKILAIAEY